MKKKIFLWAGRVGVTILVTLVLIVAGIYAVMSMLAYGPSKTARKQFILSLKETGELGFMANWFASQEEIDTIIEENSIKETDEITDTSLVVFDSTPSSEDISDIEIIDITAKKFKGKLMKVKDPSRLFIGTVPEFKNEKGWTVLEIARRYDAIGGINGGEFVDVTSQTAMPIGVVIVDEEVLHGDEGEVYHMTGITNDNILIVGNMTIAKAKEIGVRDGVSTRSSIGPFLVVNGVPQDVDGVGGGLNPRTAIGQTSDGSILLLVADGRQVTSVGASFSDMQDIMLQYGAVNAACLDGGTSTQMVYEDEVINTPYSPAGPRTLPTAFLIRK
ncbi:MAG: phosphodiester glycosidase family protein [Lachnospira sp.]